MTSSTRIISKDDLSKTGKMKVMNREVDGELQHGKHKVSANYDALVVDHSILDGPGFTLTANVLADNITGVNVSITDPTIESYRLFITDKNTLDSSISSMTFYINAQNKEFTFTSGFTYENNLYIYSSVASVDDVLPINFTLLGWVLDATDVNMETNIIGDSTSMAVSFQFAPPEKLYAYVETLKDDGVRYFSTKQLWPIAP